MKRLKLSQVVRLLLVTMVIVVVGFFALWFAVSAGSSAGSPTLAQEWRADLDRFTDPDDQNLQNWRTFLIRFKSGEWVMARVQPSHGIWYRGGGTVVIKDSKGQVRAFFGHVCAASPHAISHYENRDLKQFYEHLLETGFSEYSFE